MPNYVKEYLVKLGFEPDQPAFRRMDSVMVQAEATITQHTSGMTKNILKAQIAIVGSFAAVSSAIVAMADKIAMTDQQYRLMGLRMMMTTEAARKLDMISKALGTTIEQASWDPEVHKSWLEASERIDKVTTALGFFGGGKGEANMKGIRGFHNAFAQLGMDLKLLGMGFVSSLFEKLFPDKTGAMDKVRSWLDWFEASIPRWSDKLATHAAPILRTTWLIFKDLGEVIKTGALAFTNLIGLFSGDNAIQGATFSFEKLAGALQHVANFMKRVEDVFIDAEGVIAHTAAALSMMMHGDMAGASKELDLAGAAIQGGAQRRTAQANVNLAREDLAEAKTPEDRAAAQERLSKAQKEEGATHWEAAAMLGYGAFGLGKAALRRGAPAVGFLSRLLGGGAAAAGAAGAAGAGTVGAEAAVGGTLLGMGPVGWSLLAAAAAAGAIGFNVGGSRDWIADKLGFGGEGKPGTVPGGTPGVAGGGGLPGALAAAIARVESGGNPNALNFRNFNPGNLRSWGDMPQGEGGFAKFPTMAAGEAAELAQINKNIGRGLTLREMMGGKKGVYGGWAPKGDRNDPDAYANSVAKMLGIDPDVPLAQLSKSYGAAGAVKTSAVKQDVHISLGGVYITKPDAEVHQIQRAVADGVRDGLRSQTQFDMAQVAPAWG